MRKQWLPILVAVALAVGPVTADVWDTAVDSDNTNGTDNELVHGTIQVHDLSAQAGPAADVDWYRAALAPYSSVEVLIDGFTGDLSGATDDIQLDRLEQSGTSIVQEHACLMLSCLAKRLAWRNTGGLEESSFVRVSSAGCGTACDGDDQYTIRARETTISVARFNNAGTQITVLMTQNNGPTTVNASIFYWSATGSLLSTGTLALPPRQLNVFNTSGAPGLTGMGGSITIAHDGSYGQLNVKAVALEPSTGFSFDTPGVYRGH
jgi:hypothetical protein